MTTSYKVLSAVPKAPWNTPDGKTLAVYEVGIGDADSGAPVTDDEGAPIIASIYTLPDKPGPEVGSILNNKQLKKNKKGYSLKGIPQEERSQADVQTEQRIAQETFGGNQQPMPSQGAYTTTASTSTGGVDWDAKDRRITRLASQKVAVEILKTIGFPEDGETARKAIVAWCDWLDADANGRNR